MWREVEPGFFQKVQVFFRFQCRVGHAHNGHHGVDILEGVESNSPQRMVFGSKVGQEENVPLLAAAGVCARDVELRIQELVSAKKMSML